MKPNKETNEKAAKAKKSPDELTAPQKECLARLQHLRSVTQETAQTYLTNLEHDLLEISDFVKGGGKRSKLNRAAIEGLTGILDQLSLKPEKGRRKDLRKIEQAIEAMRKLVLK
jgi:hypothetical protein